MDQHEEIAKEAFKLYEKSGRIDGWDLENWLEAEKIVKARHEKKLTSTLKKIEQAAGMAAQKVKEKVRGLKAVITKSLGRVLNFLQRIFSLHSILNAEKMRFFCYRSIMLNKA